MNFRRVYQIFWCKSLTFNETTLHQHHEIKRQAVANSHNQHHISVARNTIPFHSPHQTHSLNEKCKHKKRLVQDATNLGM